MLKNRGVLYGLLILSILLFFLTSLFSFSDFLRGIVYGIVYYYLLRYLAILLILTIIPLIILSFSETNPSINNSEKIFKIIILGGIIVIIGSILADIFFFKGELEYIFMFAIIIFGPILGIAYLVGVIDGVIGFFKVKEKSSSRRNIIILIVTFLILGVIIFFAIYNSQSYSYKRQFQSYLNNIPIYSENGKCETLEYHIYKSTWSKSYNLECKFNSIYSLNETHTRYHSYLTSNNWRFPWDNLGLDYFLLKNMTMDYSKSDNGHFPRLKMDYNSYPKIKITIKD